MNVTLKHALGRPTIVDPTISYSVWWFALFELLLLSSVLSLVSICSSLITPSRRLLLFLLQTIFINVYAKKLKWTRRFRDSALRLFYSVNLKFFLKRIFLNNFDRNLISKNRRINFFIFPHFLELINLWRKIFLEKRSLERIGKNIFSMTFLLHNWEEASSSSRRRRRIRVSLVYNMLLICLKKCPYNFYLKWDWKEREIKRHRIRGPILTTRYYYY